MKTFATLAIVLAALANTTEAGARCHRQSYHTLRSTVGWNHSCYQCHKPQTSSQAITTLAGKKVEWEGIVNSLGKLGFVPADSPSGANYDISGQATYAPQGSTVYGYSNFTSRFGQVDLGALYNQAERLTTQAQTLAGQAATDFSALVQQEGANQAEVASIMAQGQAAERALLAARGQPAQAQLSTFQFEARVSSDGKIEMRPLEADSSHALGNQDAVTLDSVIETRCISCHSGDQPKGGLDLSARATWQGEGRTEKIAGILARITTPDPTKRMPKAADGHEGEPLTVEELKPFFDWR